LKSSCTIVVCPASLRLNWEREIENWGAALFPKSRNIHNSKTIVVRNGKTKIERCAFIIISYEQATSRVLELAGLMPDTIVVDESHYIKNRTARRTKAIVALCRLAKNCLLLSGTPMLNRPIELWCQLEALKFSLGSYWEYAKRYCGAFQGKFGWDVSGASNLGELNQKLLNNVMIRKRKADVLTELPEKRKCKISVGGLGKSPNGKALYDLCLKALKKSDFSVALAMEWLRKQNNIAADCVFSAYSELAALKADTASEIMLQLLESGNPLVVFAHHKTMIHVLCKALSEKGIPFSSITGDTALEDRQRCVDDFQTGKIKCCVLSITAASTGLTLTAASDMLITELPFAPGIALQAEDRIHRIGQKESVMIRYLCADNTLDDGLWRIINTKNRIANQTLDGIRSSDFDASTESVLGGYWNLVEGILNEIVTMQIPLPGINSERMDTWNENILPVKRIF
jgi:SWI/SNF-related matrix-associated actin-dependent regulator 1 of chromatin subfamily A